MASNPSKKIISAAAPLFPRYAVVDLAPLPSDGYMQFLVTFDTGYTVMVNRVPWTTNTPWSLVAMNLLKAARLRLNLALTNGEPAVGLCAGYSGGK